MTTNLEDKSCKELLESLKQEIQQARVRAHLAVNRELVLLYWRIGRNILDRQKVEGWGSKAIENISKDLRSEFPEMKGLSSQNLAYIRQFASEYEDIQIIQQLVGEIPWGHNIVIFARIKKHDQRIWYIQKNYRKWLVTQRINFAN